MLLTSVGVPSGLYATVRDLRRARGARLGALQRKFPVLGILLLYFLAALELLSLHIWLERRHHLSVVRGWTLHQRKWSLHSVRRWSVSA